MSESIPLFLVLVAAIVVIFFTVRIRGQVGVDDGSAMPTGPRRVLVGYLLVVGTLLVYMLISLNSIEFPETAALPDPIPVPTPTPTPSPQQSPAPAPAQSPPAAPAATPVPPPTLYRVFPQTSTTTPPTVILALYGKDFDEGSRVRFNARKAQGPPSFISENLLSIPLEAAHLVKVGAVTVEVEGKDGRLSNAISIPIKRPMVPLNVFGWRPWITREVQLLLLAIFSGALGSFFHALKSLTDFIGNRTIVSSWFWWYITRPFLGMALALVFYAVLRGGFVMGSPADAMVVSPFGVLAIGALVGMFSDKAAHKLGEVFDVVFKAGDPRSGKLDAPVIDRLEPATVTAGETNPIVLKIIGDRLGKVATVRLNAEDRKPDTVAEKEVTLKLKPEDVKTIGQIKVSVVNPDGGTSAAVTLHVSDVAITNANLSDGTAGTDYTETMTASGGTPPYKWSLVTTPPWLTIDEKTGNLKGKPAAGDAKPTPVTVNVADANGASNSKSFTLNVLP